MQPSRRQCSLDCQARISRRGFFAATAVAAAGASLRAAAQPSPAAARRPIRAYVGTYSAPVGAEGSKGNGKGIYLFEMDPESGKLTERKLFTNDSNPSWLALNADRTRLYAANETATYGDAKTGSVSAYAIGPASGDLTLINTVSSGGAGPAHLSLHPAGKHVLVANYAGGNFAVMPLAANGGLAPASDIKTGSGEIGPARAATGPRGNFAISGHEGPHGHMIQSSPDGRFVLASDLGRDKIFIWKFDAANGRLVENDPPWAAVPPGDGPRHFAFHPNGRWFYSLQEEASTVVVFDYNARSCRLTEKQTLSTLPEGFAGTNFTSEIVIAADGRFAYVANRLHDSIAWFSIDEKGLLKLRGEEPTRGDYPRSFSIDPSGRFLYSCNQRADAIAVFRRDSQTGAIRFTGQYTPVGTPAILVFL
jgi:6-phosphogluconolactonase